MRVFFAGFRERDCRAFVALLTFFARSSFDIVMP